MALELGWFAVRNVEAAALVPVLERSKECVPIKDRPSGFRIVDPPAPRASLVDSLLRRPAPAPYASVMLAGWMFAVAPVWAEAVSKELGEVVVSFVVFGGTWSYVVFDRGERLLTMDWGEELPTLSGDVSKAAAVLGVDQDLFERYRREIELVCKLCEVDEEDSEAVRAAEEALGRLRPFRGDKYRPSDEWAHVDFAKRLGRIGYPEPGTGIEMDWARPLPAPSPSDIETPLRVGDRVVHQRGMGEVASVDTIDGNVLCGFRLADGTTCNVPRSSLRPLMSEVDLSATFDVLREPEPAEQAFAERYGRYMELVKIGTGPALAEIVRDLTRKQAKGDALSFGEKRMLEAAGSRLAAEIACIRDVSPDVITDELMEAARLT